MGQNWFCQRPMLWWEMESWSTKKWGIGEKRLRTPALDGSILLKFSMQTTLESVSFETLINFLMFLVQKL